MAMSPLSNQVTTGQKQVKCGLMPMVMLFMCLNFVQWAST